MYYSIVLSMVSSNDPMNESTKAKLRCNLWLALNDVRLLLEPSEPNIQALILLACHVEDFTTPSLCWMLATNACRMLQALGVTNRSLDSRTRERRVRVFWHLNLLDKGLALIFGRPPTFHPAMTKEIPLPTLDQLLPFQPHTSAGSPGVFGAHFMHQKFSLSRIIGDIWKCLYDGDTPDDRAIAVASADLESWYHEAQKVRRYPAEGLITPSGLTSIPTGLETPDLIELRKRKQIEAEMERSVICCVSLLSTFTNYCFSSVATIRRSIQ